METADTLEDLGGGLRSSHIAAGLVLVVLLAALGFSAVANADARDQETAYLTTVEETASTILLAQQQTLDVFSRAESEVGNRSASETLVRALEKLSRQVNRFGMEDEVAGGIVTEDFQSTLSEMKLWENTTISATTLTLYRNQMVPEARRWLTDYQTMAVEKIKILASARAVNERNQAILLFTSLALFVSLLSWISISVAKTYRKAKLLISDEESKVSSAKTALAHATNQLSYQAKHDALTNLPNRIALYEKLSQFLADEPDNVVVYFCDLDRFKVVNDSRGHAVGDELLVAAAARLAKSVSDGDFLARFGGDEFVVISKTPMDRDSILRTAERFIRQLSKPFDIDDYEAYIGLSIGIATSKPNSSVNQLLRDADIAMYRAKGRPGLHITFYDEIGERLSRQLDTENALRQAIVRNELVLHWQPIVNLKNSQVHTMEALLRWRHPNGELLLPQEFLSVAEDSGLIVQMGQWVLRNACMAGSLTEDRNVSVNVSARQLQEVTFVDDLMSILSSTNFAPERLIIEVTENSLIDTSLVGGPLTRVRELGCKIALDDFGSGYSSLGLLERLPVDIIKLDRAFVKEVATSEASQAIIKSLVQLANALGMMFIAEGVETDAQRKALRSLGVLNAQGYWFGQPEASRLQTSSSRG
ncbi:MAG: putative bifunctional diguanylate cyclase/phosphodiesterase [Candidatus Nanopelagicales bacterium]